MASARGIRFLLSAAAGGPPIARRLLQGAPGGAPLGAPLGGPQMLRGTPLVEARASSTLAAAAEAAPLRTATPAAARREAVAGVAAAAAAATPAAAEAAAAAAAAGEAPVKRIFTRTKQIATIGPASWEKHQVLNPKP